MTLKKWRGWRELAKLSARESSFLQYKALITELLTKYPLSITPFNLKKRLDSSSNKLEEDRLYIGRKLGRDGYSYKIFYVTDEKGTWAEREREGEGTGMYGGNVLYITVEPHYTKLEGPKWYRGSRITYGDTHTMGGQTASGVYEAWIPLEELYDSEFHFVNWWPENPLNIKV